MKFKSLLIIILTTTVLAGAVLPALAQVQQLSFRGVITILDRLTTWMFIILLSLAVIMIIIAAYRYLTAGGDESLVAIGIGLLSRGMVFLISELAGASSGPSIQIQIPIPLPPPPPPPPFPF